MSDVRGICRKVYQETIAGMEIPAELKRSLKTHERVPAFIDNLARELGRLPFKTKRETIELCARDMTKMFIHAVMVSADQRNMSPIKKAALAIAQANANNMRKLVDRYEREAKIETTLDKAGNETTKSITVIK